MAVIQGTSDADTIEGTADADTINAGDGNDVVNGNGGDDTISGQGGNDTLNGGTGGDKLRGNGGDDVLHGGPDDDILTGGPGNDVLDGGDGADQASLFDGSGTFGIHVDLRLDGVAQDLGPLGIDTLIGIEHVTATQGNDTLIGNDAANALYGLDGEDALIGNGGDDYLEGGAGNKVFDGGSGSDTVEIINDHPTGTVGATISLLLQGQAQAVGIGNWTLTSIENLSGSFENDVFTGDDGPNTLAGSQGDDTLNGGGGDDILDGDGGIVLGDGTHFGAIQFRSDLSAFNVVPGNDTLSGGAGNDQLHGGGGNDMLDGGADNDLLYGDAGNDQLRGGTGDDLLDGGNGGDYMAGGAGDDTYVVDSAGSSGQPGDGVVELADEGTDEIQTYIDWGLPDHVENLTALGSGNLFLGGNDLANVIKGNGGNNYIVGGRGNDTIDGGGNVPDGQNSGRDVAAFQLPSDTVGDVVVVQGTGADAGSILVNLVNGGTSQTFLKVTQTGLGSAIVEGLGIGAFMGRDTVSNIEELHAFILTTTPGAPIPQNQFASIPLTANQFGNFVTGSIGPDTLDLAAFPGAHDIDGWFGDDIIKGTDANDTIRGGPGDDTLSGGGGNDVASFLLPKGTLGDMRIVEGTGAQAGKLLVQLVNGGVAETVFEVDVPSPGTATVKGVGIAAYLGTDTISTTEGLNFLVEHYPDPVPPSQAVYIPIDLYVPPIANNFAHVGGSAAPDTINLQTIYPDAPATTNLNANGGRGNDTLIGTAGTNYLIGDEGDDTLNGVSGLNDTAAFHLPAGTVGTMRFVDGAGANAGKLVVQLVKPDNSVETVFLVTIGGQGSAVVQGVNSGAFLGTDAVTNIDGLHFAVKLADGTLSTTQTTTINLTPRQSGNQLSVNGSEVSDTIDLSAYPGALNANGNRGDDDFTGTTGNNFMTGGQGADTLRGGAGDDNLVGGLNAGSGPQPGDGADTIYGDAGNDILRGGDGDDLLYGGADNDNLRGDAGSDLFDGGDGFDFASYSFGALTSGVTFDARQIGATETSIVVDPLGGTDTLRSIEALGVVGTAYDDVILGSEYTTDEGGFFANQFTGFGGADRLEGASKSDRLDGGDGNDILSGKGGNDALYGGAGDDAMSGGTGDDLLQGDGGNDAIDGGDGTDQAVFSGTKADYSFTRTDAGLVVTDLRTGSPDGQDTLTGVETLVFSDGTLDVVSLAFGTADTIFLGNSGNNVFNGTAGKDMIYGGGGSDKLNGSDNDDTIVIDAPVTPGGVINGGAGTDTLVVNGWTTGAIPGPAGLTSAAALQTGTFTGIEQLVFGSKPGTVTAIQLLIGQAAGVNQITGGAGVDNLILIATTPGTYTMPTLTRVDWTAATVSTPGDTVILVGAGTGNFTLNASAGHIGTENLVGGAGDDVLNGSDGREFLNGNGGVNQLRGNGGDDVLVIANTAPNVLVNGVVTPGVPSNYTGAGSLYDGGSGTDTLSIAGHVNFQGTITGIEVIYFQPAFSSNVLNGASQAPAELDIAAATLATLPANLVLGGTGTVNVSLAPGDSFNGSGYSFDAGANVTFNIEGSDAADTIVGTANADYIDDGDGDDTLTGGAGADVFAFSKGQNVVTDFALGQDRIDIRETGIASLAQASRYLTQVGADVRFGFRYDGVVHTVTLKNVALADLTAASFAFADPTAPRNVTGTDNGDILIGQGGNDVLNGMGGKDLIYGGGGTNQLLGGDGDDVLVIDAPITPGSVFNGGPGFDTLVLNSWPTGTFLGTAGPTSLVALYQSTVTGIEQLGFDSQVGTATTMQMVLGQAAGITQIRGNAGVDTLVLIAPTAGTFTVPTLTKLDWTTPTLSTPGDLVVLVAGGPGTFTLNASTGHSGTEALIGGAGNDTLNGSDGTELLNGGAGVNQLHGNGGDDVLVIANVTNNVLVNGVVTPGTTTTFTGAGSLFDGGAGTDGLSIGGHVNFQGTLVGIEGIYLQAAFTSNNLSAASQAAAVLDISAATIATLPAGLLLGGTGTINVSLAAGDGFNGAAYSFAAGSNVAFTFKGSDAADTIVATGNADVVLGGAGNDDLRGKSGDDRLEGGAGNDTLDGGDGVDTASFSGARDDYKIDRVNGALVVTDLRGNAPDGQDTITNVEKLSFADRQVDVASLRFGVAADGYIAGGTVFIDVNGDGILQPDTEPSALTDAQGKFTLETSAVGPLVVIGGTNLDTGLPNQVVLKAPAGSTIVNPLTTLVQAVVEQSGAPITPADAEAQVKAALGIPATLDLLTTDLIAAASAPAATPEETAAQAAALDAQKTSAAIVSVISAAKEVGGTAGEATATTALTGLVVNASSSTPVDLTVANTIETVLQNAVPPAVLTELVQSVRVETTAIDNAASLTQIAKAQALGALTGTSFDNVITGGAGVDLFFVQQGGNDTVSGAGGNDAFLFGAALTAADQVDGGSGADVLGIQGNYAGLVLGMGSLVNVETLSLISGADTRFGDTADNRYDYNVTSIDANVGKDERLIVNGAALLAGEDLTFDGSAETDGSFLIYGGAGTDVLTGGANVDVFFMADGRFNPGDRLIGGGGNDIAVLRGDYTSAPITLAADTLTSIETLTLMSAADTRFFAGGTRYSYDVTSHDGNVAAGATVTVNGGALQADEVMRFNGAAETDGAFRIFGGSAADTLTGGRGADLIYGGLGADTVTGGAGTDTFRYQAAGESTAAATDRITDFTLGDLIDLSRIDADGATEGDQAFSFIGDGAFTNQAGQLRAVQAEGGWMVSGDTNGDGVADFQVLVTVTDNHAITASDFVL